MAKIIVAAPPIPGEIFPLLQAGRGLAARGHSVTVLTGSRFRGMVEQAGLAFTPLTGSADFDIREFASRPERTSLPAGPPAMNFDVIHAFVNPMPDQHLALQELLAADPNQYLVANILFLGAWPACLGAPGRLPVRWLGVSAVPVTMSSDDTTIYGPAPAGPGQDQRAANRAANAALASALQPASDRLSEVLAGLGVGPLDRPFFDAIYVMADETAVLSVPGYEFERSDLPDNVHLVGILPGPQAEGWQPPAWWGDLDGSRPVVTVTQGTLANEDLAQLIGPALRGLANQDVTVVAALGRDPGTLPFAVPANARVAEFIPFSELLPKTDVFVTNGGSGGTHLALAAGVPAVIAGETEDKALNAARIAYHRLGINLGTATPTAAAVAGAVTSLLADTEIRGNVSRLAKVYAQHDALQSIEDLLLG
jgi:UDP:flavonoid glycosyltransferase YjiC (YdhE family)